MTTSTSEAPDAPSLIRAEATALGFDVCGFAGVDAPWPAAARLAEFVAAGPPRRRWTGWRRPPSAAPIPRAMWPEARSAIVLGLNYGPDARSAGGAEGRDRARRSRSTPRATTITT